MSGSEKEIASSDKSLISPYFLHASDHTGQVQTPFLLNGSNYERWAKLMTNSLRTKRKLGFINGTLKRPTDENEAERWEMVNVMIIRWIYSSIKPHLRTSISLVSDVSVMWSDLKARFSSGDDTCVHQLRADIAPCKQDGQAVEVYYGKLKVLWDDLSVFEAYFNCCCGSDVCPLMKKFCKTQEKILIHEFLMGLDKSRFGTARSNLLSRLGEYNIKTVYSQITQEERHLEVTQEKPETAGAVGFSATAASTTTKQNQSVSCSHCGKIGHEKHQCYKLIGYPKWFGDSTSSPGRSSSGRRRGSYRGRGRGRGGPSANQVDVARTQTPSQNGSSDSSITDSGFPNLTQTQWNSIANFVNEKQTKDKLSGKKQQLVLYGTHSKYDLIIDSGASHHMTGDINLLTNLKSINSVAISLPDGGVAWATRYGTQNLGGKLILQQVLYAPQLSITLISVSQLLHDIASCVIFTKQFCVIQDLASRTLIGAGEERDGVYHLTGSVLPQVNHASKKDIRNLWHRRLGHPSSKVLSYLSDLGKFSTSNSDLDELCDTCNRAKQTRVTFQDSSNRADDLFSLIHCDLWGPFREKSSCGASYFLTIVDDCSRALWTFLLLEKSEVGNVLKNFFALVDRQFNDTLYLLQP